MSNAAARLGPLWETATMTPKQAALLEQIRTRRGMFLHGAEVRVGRALEAAGLITIEDNGKMLDTPGGRDDRERWWAEPVVTASETVALRALRGAS